MLLILCIKIDHFYWGSPVPQEIQKIYWEDLRKGLKKIRPDFVSIVDRLSPGKKLPMYKAFYPYGSIIGDREYFYYPINNELKKLTDTPSEIASAFEYAKNKIPAGMILNNTTEIFVEFRDMTIPTSAYVPGTFFALPRSLDTSGFPYHPSKILIMTSGARSIFMLPNIGDASHHVILQRELNLKIQPPKVLNDHWKIFRSIASHKNLNCDWSACLLLFPGTWIEKIFKDKSWHELKQFLYEEAWKKSTFRRNQIYYDLAFSIFQNKKNLKPDPYLVDTAKHLLSIAVGSLPGFSPAINDNFAPIKLFEEVYVNIYGLKKYLPTIMVPQIFNYLDPCRPVYYSLQYPSTLVFSPTSRKISSTLHKMRELKYITDVLFDELASNSSICTGTMVEKIANSIQLDFYHNKSDRHDEIRLSHNIAKEDKNFLHNASKQCPGAKFSESAPFVRGCVKISG